MIILSLFIASIIMICLIFIQQQNHINLLRQKNAELEASRERLAKCVDHYADHCDNMQAHITYLTDLIAEASIDPQAIVDNILNEKNGNS